MLSYIQITDEKPTERRGTVTADGPNKGKPYHRYTQKFYVHQGAPFPEMFEMSHDANNGEVPYAPGFYLPAAGTFERIPVRYGEKADNRNAGQLGLSRNMRLVPFKEAMLKMDDVLRASSPASPALVGKAA